VSVATGGQILLTGPACSSAVHNVRQHSEIEGAASPLPQVRWIEHGPYLFQGSDAPLELFEVGAVGIAPLRPPPDGPKARRMPRYARPTRRVVVASLAGVALAGAGAWRLKHRTPVAPPVPVVPDAVHTFDLPHG